MRALKVGHCVLVSCRGSIYICGLATALAMSGCGQQRVGVGVVIKNQYIYYVKSLYMLAWVCICSFTYAYVHVLRVLFFKSVILVLDGACDECQFHDQSMDAWKRAHG